MNNYEINVDTLAILPYEEGKSKVIESKREIIVNCLPIDIIDNSCKFFGSTYDGRFNGTKDMLGVSHKSPILIEESKKIIFFPTKSPRLIDCAWISLSNIESYERVPEGSLIKFYCGKTLKMELSYGILDNQVLRATRLESILNKRIGFLCKNI